MGEKIMADQKIPEPDSSTTKTKRDAAISTATAPDVNPNTDGAENASPLFEVAGVVSPSARTEGAAMPDAPPGSEKRGRGGPKGGTNAKKKTPRQAEAEGAASAQIIVSGLDLVRRAVSGGECLENPEMRGATLQAWEEYLRENGWEVPAWVQVSVISVAYVAPAFATESGKGKIGGLWAKIKGWWIARRG